jgi:hypothetical protein
MDLLFKSRHSTARYLVSMEFEAQLICGLSIEPEQFVKMFWSAGMLHPAGESRSGIRSYEKKNRTWNRNLLPAARMGSAGEPF